MLLLQQLQLDGSTHPCKTEQCGGGVGRNIAEALWRLRSGGARLLTAVGDDADGRYLADIAPGLLLDGCIVKNARTATYAAVLGPSGECLLGFGDMALHDHITVDLVNKHISVLDQSPLVVIDGNVPEATIHHVLQVCQRKQKPVFFEPTDRRKAVTPLKAKLPIAFSSPNINELRAMADYLTPKISSNDTDDLNEVLRLATIVSKSVEFLIVTLGEKGVLTVKNTRGGSIKARFYPVTVIRNVENVSGAGDCFTGGFIAGMLTNNKESVNINIGYQSAKHALLCKNTVPSNLSMSNITLEDSEYELFKINC